MNQKSQLLEMFEKFNGELTLGFLLKTTLSAEYRKIISLLRKDGYKIECIEDRKNPGDNRYILKNRDFNSKAVLRRFEGTAVGLPANEVESAKNVYSNSCGRKIGEVVQVTCPCPECGSYYRRFVNGQWVCNKKGSHDEN